MQTAKKNGQFVFEPDQFLTTSQIKSYFSRLTRERKKNFKKSETNVDHCEMLSNDDEDVQIQEDEDDSDFDSALTDAKTYELLDNAIDVLDDLLLQQQSN